MTVKLAPVFNEATLDSNGNPYSGAQLFTYAAGSTTKQTTYQDSAAGSSHTNPIILNSRGEPPAPIWLTAGSTYKFVLTTPTDSDPPVASIRSIDNVSGVNDSTTTMDQWVTGPAPTYVSATSFTLVGDQTTVFHVGRRLKTTNTGGAVYSQITASAYGALTTVTVVNDSGTLDSGLSAVSYGLLSANNTSAPKIAGITVAAHATTMNPWGADIATLSGGAVTFTDIADAAFVGQEVLLVMNAAHVWTDGAVFDVQGGANYTAAAGDMLLLTATAVDAFDVTIFKANGTAVIASSSITLGTAQASTSGTSIDFTGIPSGTKRVTINLVGVSTNGSSHVRFQLGDAGGIETSGYLGGSLYFGGTNEAGGTNPTAGFEVADGAATFVLHGTITFTLENAATFTWSAAGLFATSSTNFGYVIPGSKSLSAELDRVRITTAGGADTFDAGAINITYES